MTQNTKHSEYTAQDYFDGHEFNILDFFFLLLKHWPIIIIVGLASGLLYFLNSNQKPALFYKTTIPSSYYLAKIDKSRERYNGFIFNRYTFNTNNAVEMKDYIRSVLGSPSFQKTLPTPEERNLLEKISFQSVPAGLQLSILVTHDAANEENLISQIVKNLHRYIETTPHTLYGKTKKDVKDALKDLDAQTKLIRVAFEYSTPDLDIYRGQINAKKALFTEMRDQWEYIIKEINALQKSGSAYSGALLKKAVRSNANMDSALAATLSLTDKLGLLLQQADSYGKQMNTLIDEIKALQENFRFKLGNIAREKVNMEQEASSVLSLINEQQFDMQNYLDNLEKINTTSVIEVFKDAGGGSLKQRIVTSIVIGIGVGIAAAFIVMAFRCKKKGISC